MARSLSWMDVSGLDASAWDPGTYFWQFVNRIKTKKSHIQMIHFKPKTKCIHILFCNFCFMNTFRYPPHTANAPVHLTASPGRIQRMRRGRGWKWQSRSTRTSAASPSAARQHPPSWRARSWSQSRTHGCPLWAFWPEGCPAGWEGSPAQRQTDQQLAGCWWESVLSLVAGNDCL